MSRLTRVTDLLVKFKAGFISAVERLLSDKLDESVSVDDFGAKGDGITIDDVPIQAALDSGAKVIKLTHGKTYVVKNGITIPSGVTLTGYGASIKYIKPDFNYNHCITIKQSATGVNIFGIKIYGDASFVRDDTGFGISLFKCDNVTIRDVNISLIGSAAIWHTATSRTTISNCTVANCRADGIHISDDCTYFKVIGCTVNGCEDDHIAVVSDIPSDGTVPRYGVISNNLVSNGTAGHGILLIGCADVLVDANVIRGMNGSGIGSYFWGLTAAPLEEDWVRNCTISNNHISDCALNPLLKDNATPFFVGALKDCIVKGNVIKGAFNSRFTALGVEGNCITIHSCLDTNFVGNILHSSAGHGIQARDDLAQDNVRFNYVHIEDNVFENIAKDAVHFNTLTTARLGILTFTGNTINKSGYTAGWGRVGYISNVSTAVVARNSNTFNSLGITVNNVIYEDIYSNVPAIVRSWTPSMSGQGGTPVGTVTGQYWREGNTLHFHISANITSVGGASNPTFSLPYPAAISSSMAATGRENANSGKMLNGIMDSVSVLRTVNYDNTATFAGMTTASVSVRGKYLI